VRGETVRRGATRASPTAVARCSPQVPAPEPPRTRPPEPPGILAPADPALAELDQRRISARRRSTGAAAAGALEDLVDGDDGPSIPRQTRPDQS
jgi:hypothetical protein